MAWQLNFNQTQIRVPLNIDSRYSYLFEFRLTAAPHGGNNRDVMGNTFAVDSTNFSRYRVANDGFIRSTVSNDTENAIVAWTPNLFQDHVWLWQRNTSSTKRVDYTVNGVGSNYSSAHPADVIPVEFFLGSVNDDNNPGSSLITAFLGIVRELKIYEAATPGTIDEVPDVLIAHYKLDEGPGVTTGGTIVDYSGLANHATLHALGSGFWDDDGTTGVRLGQVAFDSVSTFAPNGGIVIPPATLIERLDFDGDTLTSQMPMDLTRDGSMALSFITKFEPGLMGTNDGKYYWLGNRVDLVNQRFAMWYKPDGTVGVTFGDTEFPLPVGAIPGGVIVLLRSNWDTSISPTKVYVRAEVAGTNQDWIFYVSNTESPSADNRLFVNNANSPTNNPFWGPAKGILYNIQVTPANGLRSWGLRDRDLTDELGSGDDLSFTEFDSLFGGVWRFISDRVISGQAQFDSASTLDFVAVSFLDAEWELNFNRTYIDLPIEIRNDQAMAIELTCRPTNLNNVRDACGTRGHGTNANFIGVRLNITRDVNFYVSDRNQGNQSIIWLDGNEHTVKLDWDGLGLMTSTIDGTGTMSNSYAPEDGTTINPMTIGDRNFASGSGSKFIGVISDVNVYQSGVLVASYPIDDGTGATQIRDRLGGPPATLQSMGSGNWIRLKAGTILAQVAFPSVSDLIISGRIVGETVVYGKSRFASQASFVTSGIVLAASIRGGKVVFDSVSSLTATGTSIVFGSLYDPLIEITIPADDRVIEIANQYTTQK